MARSRRRLNALQRAYRRRKANSRKAASLKMIRLAPHTLRGVYEVGHVGSIVWARRPGGLLLTHENWLD